MQLSLSHAAIWMHHEPVDFRKSIDGLCEIVLSQFEETLKQGIFVFFNRARDKLKILSWHGNGFVLLYKRLERDRFSIDAAAQSGYALSDNQLSWLMAGLDWHKMTSWKTLDFKEII